MEIMMMKRMNFIRSNLDQHSPRELTSKIRQDAKAKRDERILELEQENRQLRQEIRVAHEAAELTAQLVIEQFDPSQDRLDLLGFWAEGQQAQLVDLGSAGTRVDLPFNQQSITLSGVNINQLSGGQLLIWGG